MKISMPILALFLVFQLQAQIRDITVTGTATKLVNADELVVNVGFNTESSNAETAFSTVQNKMREAIAYLEKLKGVKTFETDVVRLNRSYPKTPVKFTAIQSLSITLTNFELYEELMIKLMDMGFNTVGGVHFNVSDLSKHKREVQLQAIESAKQKATDFADALGVELGVVLGFAENDFSAGPRPMYNYRAADAAPSPEPSIAPGQVEITMQVVVSYAIIKTP